MLGEPDISLFYWINQTWQSEFLDRVFIFFSLAIRDGWVRAALALVLIFYLAYNPKTRTSAIQAMIAWPLADLLCNVFKYTLPALRPAVQLDDVRIIVPFLESPGTMSAHAATMAAIATVFLLRCNWKWALPWMFVAFMTGLSRVYVGAHFPSQVLFGWMGGVFVGLVVVKVWNSFVYLRSQKINAQAEDPLSQDSPTQ